jgi:hypothetical protein
MKNKKKHKLFDAAKEKSIKYVGMLPLEDYQKEYFIGYPYGYWLHKGLAILHFIENRSMLHALRFPKDVDSDEFIIENLKMEIHMMVFHSAESLFLTVLAHYFYPAMPWFWMSTCTQNKFNNVMNLWQEKGLEAIIKEPEKWLRDILYPTINESHEAYLKTKDSALFAKKYLDRLMQEYLKHREYNAYKHGLRIFPGQTGFLSGDLRPGEAVRGIEGDLLQFLKYELHEKNDYEYHMKHISQEYDVKVDINIISTTTRLLQNFLETRRVETKATEGQKITVNLALFDKMRIEDIFSTGYFELST